MGFESSRAPRAAAMGGAARVAGLLVLLLFAGCAAFEPEPAPEPPKAAVAPPPPPSPPEPSPVPAQPVPPETAYLGTRGGALESGARTLSPDELRGCAERSQRMDLAASELAALRAGLEHRRREITRRGRELAQERETVNLKQARRVKDFNERARRHRDRVASFEADLRWYNEQAHGAVLGILQYGAQCTEHPYRLADAQGLDGKLQEALKRTLKPFEIPAWLPAERGEALLVPEALAGARARE